MKKALLLALGAGILAPVFEAAQAMAPEKPNAEAERPSKLIAVTDNNSQSPMQKPLFNNMDYSVLLFIASSQGYLETLNALIETGADVNSTRADGVTPLWIAAEEGRVKVVDALLKAGANVNLADIYGITPLWIAAANGHEATVKILLEHIMKLSNGRDIIDHQAAGVGNVTPLFVAAQNGRVGTVDALLKAGANVNLAIINGATPLWIAAENGHEATVNVLLEHIMGLENKKAIIDYQVAGANVTALYIAAQNGYLGIVMSLIVKGAEIDIPDSNGVTPLLVATANGHDEIVQLLVSLGADISKTNRESATPLLVALQNGHIRVALELLKCMIRRMPAADQLATLTQPDCYGHTAFMTAQHFGYANMADLLALITEGLLTNGYVDPVVDTILSGHSPVENIRPTSRSLRSSKLAPVGDR